MRRLPPVGATLRDTTDAINQLIDGRSNAVFAVTATLNAGSTLIESDLINANAVPLLFPATAAAAAEVATTYAVTTSAGVVTVTHANNATANRTWHVLIIGG
jgi:hypothetical protein